MHSSHRPPMHVQARTLRRSSEESTFDSVVVPPRLAMLQVRIPFGPDGTPGFDPRHSSGRVALQRLMSFSGPPMPDFDPFA